MNKKYIYLLSFAAVAGIILLAYRAKKKEKQLGAMGTNNGNGGGLSSSQNNNSGGALDMERILKKGDSGEEVRALQKMLAEDLEISLSRDGQFGQKTEEALKEAASIVWGTIEEKDNWANIQSGNLAAVVVKNAAQNGQISLSGYINAIRD